MKTAIYYSSVVVVAACVVAAMKMLPSSGNSHLNSGNAPVRVRGLLTQGANPLAGVSLAFAVPGGQVQGVAKSDKHGRFNIGLGAPGDYLVIVSASQNGAPTNLSSTGRVISVTAGNNDLVIDLPPTRVDVVIRADGLSVPDLVQLALAGPASPNGSWRVGFATKASGFLAAYVGIGFGDYVLTAFTASRGESDALTSREPATFSVSASHPTARVTLWLVKRKLRVEVKDTDGHPIVSADTTTLNRSLPRSSDGSFDASGVPRGQELIIITPGRLPVCVLALASGVQSVVAPLRGKNMALVNLRDAPSRPLGDLVGLPGSQCPIPLSALSFDWSPRTERGDLKMAITGLPAGTYGYRSDEQSPLVTVEAPGKAVTYRVPAFCKVCGGVAK
jgi:hypothetical protein